MLPPLLRLVDAFLAGARTVPILTDTPTACEIVTYLSGYVCHEIETLSTVHVPQVFLFDPVVWPFRIELSRDIIARAYVESETGGRVLFLIRGMDRATPEAQNTLLKLFEENLDGILFLLITENPDQLLPTIRSRIMVFSHDTALREIPEKLVRALDRYATGDTTDLLAVLYHGKDEHDKKYERIVYIALLERIGEYIRDGRIVDSRVHARFAEVYMTVASTNVTAKWWVEYLCFGRYDR